MWHPNEDYDADGRRILGKSHPKVSVEERFPGLSGREEDGDQHGTNRANDCIKESSERQGIMSTLQLLYSFVKIYDAIQERENLGGEGGYVSHGPIMSVKDGEKVVHPCCMDEGPRHKRKEWYLRRLGSAFLREELQRPFDLRRKNQHKVSICSQQVLRMDRSHRGW